MSDKLYDLQTLIDIIVRDSDIHICIQDVSGILSCDALTISSNYSTHTKPWCATAKTTSDGLNLCLRSKALANQKAVREQKLFTGRCPFGIREIVQPVVINNTTMCVIYIGNIIDNETQLWKKTHRISQLTGVDVNSFKGLEKEMCHADDLSHYYLIAKLIAGYILLVYDYFNYPINTGKHWAVTTLKNYIYADYDKDISLTKCAKIVELNSDYLGQIFKRETGLEFTKFLHIYRISKACEMLRTTAQPVINVAMNTGFNNVTYFNKIFKRIIGFTPSEYRNIGCPRFNHPILNPPSALNTSEL